jgi:hypothetical protein
MYRKKYLVHHMMLYFSSNVEVKDIKAQIQYIISVSKEHMGGCTAIFKKDELKISRPDKTQRTQIHEILQSTQRFS